MSTILFADDDQELRESWSTLLRGQGFRVFEADSIAKGREVCKELTVDLAIVDLNLDHDEGNGSPAGRAIDPAVPTIAIADLPAIADPAAMKLAFEAVRNALRQRAGWPPPAVDFLDKKEGPQALLVAVRKTMRPRIFVVHGHDSEARESLLLFLEKLRVRPVVLDEKAGIGRTIIEKFEDWSDVGYAIVLLTNDDVGGPTVSELRPRARQNVIFELGYFIGKLGRRKVATLCKTEDEEIELPSDYIGVQCLKMDQWGAWKTALAKEMSQAQIDIDKSWL